MLASQFVPTAGRRRGPSVRFTALGARRSRSSCLAGALTAHRRPRPRRRRPVHLLPVLMRPDPDPPRSAGRPAAPAPPAASAASSPPGASWPRCSPPSRWPPWSTPTPSSSGPSASRSGRAATGRSPSGTRCRTSPTSRQLHRLRDLGDCAGRQRGRGRRPVVPAAPAADDHRAPPRRAVPPRRCCGTRPPRAPLRVYIGGDSIVRDAGESFLRLAGEQPAVRDDAPLRDRHRPDPPRLLRLARGPRRRHGRRTEPEVAFIMFGGNDAQGIVAPDGTAYQRVQRRRLAGRVRPPGRRRHGRAPARDDRLVFWIGLPPMRESGFDGRAEVMNGIYREQAASRPWMTYVDTRPALRRRRTARYVERKPDQSGDLVDLRQADGVHLELRRRRPARPGAARPASTRRSGRRPPRRRRHAHAAAAQAHRHVVRLSLRHAERRGDRRRPRRAASRPPRGAAARPPRRRRDGRGSGAGAPSSTSTSSPAGLALGHPRARPRPASRATPPRGAS